MCDLCMYFILFLILFSSLCRTWDEDAIQCKVVALIKADRIEDTVLTIQSSQKVPIDFSFFKVVTFSNDLSVYAIISF
jgi:hypothetical protein